MIVASMKYKEMYDALEKDVSKLQIWIDKTMPKSIRFFEKQLSFPQWHIEEYEHQDSHIKYVIFFYAGTRNEIKNPHYTSYGVVFFENHRYVVQGTFSDYQHTPKCQLIRLPQINAYTSHFLKRYNERFLHKKTLSPNEIAGLFLIRNPFPMPIMLNEDVNKNYKEHGEHNDRGMRVPDGFCFTQTDIDVHVSEDGIHEHDKVDAILVLYTTFMNESEMSDTQKAAINKEHFETFMRCMKEQENRDC